MAYYVSIMPSIWTKFVAFFCAFWRGQAQLFQKHKKIVFCYCGEAKLLSTLKESLAPPQNHKRKLEQKSKANKHVRKQKNKLDTKE
jgi:hypothetical protein